MPAIGRNGEAQAVVLASDFPKEVTKERPIEKGQQLSTNVIMVLETSMTKGSGTPSLLVRLRFLDGIGECTARLTSDS